MFKIQFSSNLNGLFITNNDKLSFKMQKRSKTKFGIKYSTTNYWEYILFLKPIEFSLRKEIFTPMFGAETNCKDSYKKKLLFNWEKQKSNGISYGFYENGKINTIAYLHNAKIKDSYMFDSFGKINSFIMMKDKFTRKQITLLNNNIETISYWNGARKQIAKSYEFYENGKIHKIMNWCKGKKHGITIYFYSDNRIKGISYWNNGKCDGKMTIYNQLGKIIKYIYWVNGERKYDILNMIDLF
jgi:antitoxin component YwqK of YwqJK toxin-antitoxin module